MSTDGLRIDDIEAWAYTVPTDHPEADGTFAWKDTTIVVVTVKGGGHVGTGWTYGSMVTAALVRNCLAPLLTGRTFETVHDAWTAQVLALRNVGRPGIGSMAVSAIDCALWDLQARCQGLPLYRLLGARRDQIPVYGSGGFTSYDDAQLTDQLEGWLEQGVDRVKIKIGEAWGQHPERDVQRVRRTREYIGPSTELFVDANGAYTHDQALHLLPELEELGVRWLEEPVSSDDLDGLADLRSHSRADVAAGEYGYDLAYFRHLCDAKAVDCVQVDVTRCGGFTELMVIADLVDQHRLDVSGHGAPYLSAAVLSVIPNLRHQEWFHDHVRIEQRFLDGATPLRDGHLVLDDTVLGHGLTWRAEAASPYRVF